MRFLKKTNIDFMGKRNLWYMVSLSVICIGMISIPIKGGLVYGLDFTGGTELVIQFSQPVDISQVRSVMDASGYEKSEIKRYGEPTKILIRTKSTGEGTTVGDKIRMALQEKWSNLQPQVLQAVKVSPKVGAEYRQAAFMAVLFSLIAMLIYIGFRFKFVYGVGAVVALFHDVLVTVGMVSLVGGLSSYTNFEFDQNMIAAILTLVGLSVNDTVVIFDRLRENQKIHRSMGLMDLMNKSLNETLSRTIITSATILFVTIVLFLFGGEVLRGFAFALTIGMITGTYSSIYIASAVVLEVHNYKERKKLAIATA
jgi:preprotein translocase subunit SecF